MTQTGRKWPKGTESEFSVFSVDCSEQRNLGYLNPFQAFQRLQGLIKDENDKLPLIMWQETEGGII